MPSRSKSQHNLMEMTLHSKKKTGISKKVAKEFVRADQKRGKAALRKLPWKKN